MEEGKRRGEEILSMRKFKSGIDMSSEVDSDLETGDSHGVYYIGKVLWAKGFDRMLDLQAFYRQVTGDYFPIDIFGSGPGKYVLYQF